MICSNNEQSNRNLIRGSCATAVWTTVLGEEGEIAGWVMQSLLSFNILMAEGLMKQTVKYSCSFYLKSAMITNVRFKSINVCLSITDALATRQRFDVYACWDQCVCVFLATTSCEHSKLPMLWLRVRAEGEDGYTHRTSPTVLDILRAQQAADALARASGRGEKIAAFTGSACGTKKQHALLTWLHKLGTVW